MKLQYIAIGFIIGILAEFTLVLYAMNVASENQEEYDYIINLDDDDIDIKTEDGKHYMVHPDSLEEFIMKDNL